MPLMTAPPSFYRETPAGRECRGCDQVGPHAAECPLVGLRRDVREFAAELGSYVAGVREVLDRIDALLRGDEVPRW